jgi:serine/threonine protein kinase
VGLTKTQASFGSIPYMAPEQMRNAKYCDERTDIWALGVTLYELVTQCYIRGNPGNEKDGVWKGIKDQRQRARHAGSDGQSD